MNHAAWWRQTRWHVAGFLAFAAALNYADRAAISSVLPALRSEFKLSDTQLGLVGSMFLWAYALASPLAGLLADRWSRRSQVVWSLVLWSGVTALVGVANGLLVLLILRAALGLAESLYLPAATALIADHHPSRTRGRAMSVHSIGLNFGVVLGGASAGYLAEHFGWRSGFWVLGLAGVGLAFASRTFLPAAPGAHAALGGRPQVPVLETLRYLAGVRSYHVLFVKAMLAGVGVWIFMAWLPLYFGEAFKLSLGDAGLAGTFMLQVSVVLGVAFGGWISDRAAARDARQRMLVQALCYFGAAPFLLLFLARPGFAAVTVAVSAFSLLRGMGQANENPALCEVIPVQYRSTAIGFMNTGATAAGGVGVLIAGVLKRSLGLDAIFAGISMLFVMGGLAMLAAYRFWMRRDIEQAQRHSARDGAVAGPAG